MVILLLKQKFFIYTPEILAKWHWQKVEDWTTSECTLFKSFFLKVVILTRWACKNQAEVSNMIVSDDEHQSLISTIDFSLYPWSYSVSTIDNKIIFSQNIVYIMCDVLCRKAKKGHGMGHILFNLILIKLLPSTEKTTFYVTCLAKHSQNLTSK